MTKRISKRRSSRPRRALRYNPGFPWDGHVVPVDASDLAYARRQLRVAKMFGRSLPAIAIFMPETDGYQRRFYRRGSPRLGEPVSRTSTGKHMYCGRDSGHLGSGLYFFGTLRAAATTDWTRELDEMELIDPPANVYRVEDGPQNPYITGAAAKDAEKLHRFGRALICLADSIRDEPWLRLRRQIAQARAELDLAIANDDDREYELTTEHERLKRRHGDAIADIQRDLHTIQFAGPRSEPVGVWNRSAPPPLSPRVADAIRRYQTEGLYHPMTYYMRSLGYDGVLHTNDHEFESGGMGCIWYPEVS